MPSSLTGLRLSRPPQAGDWDYDGACLTWSGASVSLGIFQWVPKSSGRGVKRGPVQKRIKGLPRDLARMTAEAEAWIAGKAKA